MPNLLLDGVWRAILGVIFCRRLTSDWGSPCGVATRQLSLMNGGGRESLAGVSVEATPFGSPDVSDFFEEGSGKILVYQAARRSLASGFSRPSNTAARTTAMRFAPCGDHLIRCFLAMRALAISSTVDVP